METIKQIVEQLSKCNYECEGGSLINNTAFIRLKEISNLNYQPKFNINERVYYNGKLYYVRGVMAKTASHPNPEVDYMLNEKYCRECTTNKSDEIGISESALMSYDQFQINELEKAKKLLEDSGFTINSK